MEREVADALEPEYGTRIDVTVRSAAELAALLGREPLPRRPAPAEVTVAFLTGSRARRCRRPWLAAVATDVGALRRSTGREVWVRYGDGQRPQPAGGRASAPARRRQRHHPHARHRHPGRRQDPGQSGAQPSSRLARTRTAGPAGIGSSLTEASITSGAPVVGDLDLGRRVEALTAAFATEQFRGRSPVPRKLPRAPGCRPA